MQTDYVQRFMFENLDIRGRLVCLTGAWQRMLDGRGYPEDIVSLLVADCTAELRIRGMAHYEREAPENEMSGQETERELIGDGRLSVTLDDLKSGKFYQSLVPLEGETM